MVMPSSMGADKYSNSVLNWEIRDVTYTEAPLLTAFGQGSETANGFHASDIFLFPFPNVVLL